MSPRYHTARFDIIHCYVAVNVCPNSAQTYWLLRGHIASEWAKKARGALFTNEC